MCQRHIKICSLTTFAESQLGETDSAEFFKRSISQKRGMNLIHHFIVFPNHLRPSYSKKGLYKGKLSSPRNFKDRLMLTDVGAVFLETIRARGLTPNMILKWDRDYFPWMIRAKVGKIEFELRGEIIGASSWQSIIEITPEAGPDNSRRRYADSILADFRKKLGREPWESPYWSDEDVLELSKKKNTTLAEVKLQWDFSVPSQV